MIAVSIEIPLLILLLTLRAKCDMLTFHSTVDGSSIGVNLMNPLWKVIEQLDEYRQTQIPQEAKFKIDDAIDTISQVIDYVEETPVFILNSSSNAEK